MYGRSRMAIHPRILTMPGRSTSGFHRPGKVIIRLVTGRRLCVADERRMLRIRVVFAPFPLVRVVEHRLQEAVALINLGGVPRTQ